MENQTLNQLTVDQKFARILLDLRILRPFYSAVYEVIEKIETDSVTTMGVTVDKLLYNRNFVEMLPYDSLLFVVLHEVAHIALQHVARKEGRDPQLWNLACDYYVNEMLSQEFNLPVPNSTSYAGNGITLRMPPDILYCSSIDLDQDYTEKLYLDLESQANKNGYFENKLNGDMGTKQFKFNMQGSKDEKGDAFRYGYGRENIKDSFKNVEITVDVNTVYDLIDNGEDSAEKNQKANKVIADAIVREDMRGTQAGSVPGLLEAQVRKLLTSEIDWKKLLKKYLIAATSKDSSFSRPDRRMFYQNAIYPGQVSDELSEVHGVKVCIDTSGSISDEDLGHFLGQVYQLCKTYKVKAELVYWDAEIESIGEFETYKEFERVDVYGRGGTEPRVVFDYLSSKKCKVKPIVTLMFTDGYFGDNYNTPKYRRMFRDTIWVMNRGHNQDFEPAFGKKAIAKFK